MKSPIDACHHVAIVVRDAAAARAFYGDLLGLEELERPADVGARFAGAWYRIGALELHVFEQPDFSPPAAPIGPHIALHTADFDGLVARLRCARVRVRVRPRARRGRNRARDPARSDRQRRRDHRRSAARLAPRRKSPHERPTAAHRSSRRRAHRADGADPPRARGGGRGGGRDRRARRGARAEVRRDATASRRSTRATTRCSPTTRSTRSTTRCRTDCTPSGRSARSRRASTCCARSRSPRTPPRRRRWPQAAERTGRVLTEAFHWRYHPLAARMREVVQTELGEIRHIEAMLCFPLPFFNDIRYSWALAGGAMMDAGCYTVNMVRWLAGAEPEVVSAEARLARPNVDRYMRAELRFPDGRTARVTASLFSARLAGDQGVGAGQRRRDARAESARAPLLSLAQDREARQDHARAHPGRCHLHPPAPRVRGARARRRADVERCPRRDREHARDRRDLSRRGPAAARDAPRERASRTARRGRGRPARGAPRRRRRLLPRHSVCAAADRRAALPRARAGRAVERRARRRGVRRRGAAERARRRRAAGHGGGRAGGGLPVPERLHARGRRGPPARDGVDPRRRVRARRGVAAALRRPRARAARRRRRGDDQLPARRARLPRPRGAARRRVRGARPTSGCSIRSPRSRGCARTSRASAAIRATSRSSANRRAA